MEKVLSDQNLTIEDLLTQPPSWSIVSTIFGICSKRNQILQTSRSGILQLSWTGCSIINQQNFWPTTPLRFWTRTCLVRLRP